jgi:hypothetical protein
MKNVKTYTIIIRGEIDNIMPEINKAIEGIKRKQLKSDKEASMEITRFIVHSAVET